MLLSLYTVRVLLNVLGIVDYGIYNIIGSIVILFSFLSGTLASASQRFFAFEIGKSDSIQLNRTFSAILLIYWFTGIVILISLETIGLWVLNCKMNIPVERVAASQWVYHFSVLSFVLTVITIPYNASIIAHEDMKVYAYVSIIESVLKLVIVFFIGYFLFDKLKLYSALIFFITSLITLIYYAYCKQRYKECSFRYYWDKKLIISIFSYSGWNMIGAIANIAKNQGINILLNIFYGPVVNAARAVSFQIYGALTQFVTNLYSATRPQITKYYAQDQMLYMWKLVFQSTKFSYYLFMILSIPIFFEIEYLLILWLDNIPSFTPLITRLVLIGFMIEAMSNQLVAVLQAANKIKRFQLISSSILLLNLPVSYMFLKWGSSPYIPFVISIIVTVLYMIPQILITKKEVNLPLSLYLRDVAKLIIVTILSIIFPFLIHGTMDFGMTRFMLVLLASLLSSILFIWYIGFNRDEKIMIVNYIKNKYHANT
jgi:O-antigen/teichoic acid export membrane protein